MLETPRLRLRRHRAEDFAASAAMWADPIVTRYIGGKPSTQEESWSRVLRYAGHWDLCGWGYWLVEERAGGAFVGEIGFADFKRDLDPPLGELPELGWALAARAHGQGLATEGVQAALAWGDQHLRRAATVCLIHPDNAASIRVAEKCGFHATAHTSYKGAPTILFRRAAP
jgi:RimJ/RimL family protein N-acetyltransferase